MIALERKSTGTLDRGPRVPYIHPMPAATTRPVIIVIKSTSPIAELHWCAKSGAARPVKGGHIFGSSLENVQRWAGQMVQLHEASAVHTLHVAG